ncbi:hypothetical protein [Motilimonas eburnea]|uniref:hypothetical protein n=1 Tax=Motilimonas eburnea TaxID=1737488 RepID=UPI001E49448B|nr:hypothetical protein [Motilimonas eburnea]MCE2573746.1 hypothetical protein [Motilimonas eburnea]
MFSDSQKIETYKALGQIAMSSGGSEYKCAWAMSLLEQGVDSPSLVILATLLKPINEFEADDYFNRVLKELNIERPSDAGAIEGYARVLMKEVIDGSLALEMGASMIYGAYIKLGYPELFGEFTVLEDDWYCECINGWSKEK